MLVLPTELTHVQAGAALNLLLQAARAEAGEQVCVDAGALARFDSSALAVLLEVRRACLRGRKTFVVRDLGARLRTLAGLYGVDGLLPPAGAPAAAPADPA